jgi:hypothetical protein
MDSLPKQHIDSLPEELREKAYKQVAWLWAARMYEEITSEEELASRAKFPSVEAMRASLQNWGLAGILPQTRGLASKPRQPGPGTGRGTELPAVSQACELFAETLRDLLARVADLEFRHDSSQDGRVVGTDTIAESAYLSRWCEINGKTIENSSEEQWDDLCSRHGQDPAVEGFWVEDSGLNRAAGAARQPAEPETTLIGVYALAGGDMERLLELLYPGTLTQEAREAVRKHVEGKKNPDKIDGLKTVAGQLAALVRGQSIVGRPPIDLTAVEHDAACYITELRGEEHSDEEILAKLSNHKMADGSKLSMEDVHRLGNLRLRYTEG